MKTIDEYILDRLRQVPPSNCTVVPGSTPVIPFRKFKEAHIATISLNQSHREFDIVNGNLRFHTLKSLGIENYEDISEQYKDLIIDYCERYFERPGIVYNEWFKKISNFIKGSTGYDYYNGTACHLDLSQWATSEIWGN